LAIVINLVLACFNLIPIPPLDGSRIAVGLLPDDLARQYLKIERYGMLIIFGFLFLGLFEFILWPLVRFLFIMLAGREGWYMLASMH
jgi:Zn-dependent protease